MYSTCIHIQDLYRYIKPERVSRCGAPFRQAAIRKGREKALLLRFVETWRVHVRIEGFSKETVKMRHANCRPSRSCYQKHSLRWKPCGKSRLAASSLKILRRCSQVQVGFLNPQQYDDEHLAHRAFVHVQTRWRQF